MESQSQLSTLFGVHEASLWNWIRWHEKETAEIDAMTLCLFGPALPPLRRSWIGNQSEFRLKWVPLLHAVPLGFSLWNHKSGMALKQNFGEKNISSLFTVFWALSLCLFFLFFYSAYRTVSPQFDRQVYKSHTVTLWAFLLCLVWQV